MSVLTGGRARWAVLGAIVGALAVAGIAWADIPDSAVIHGCYKTVGGSLRVIDASLGEACKSGEKSLPWNQTGPTGTSGAGRPDHAGSGQFSGDQPVDDAHTHGYGGRGGPQCRHRDC